MIGLELKRLGVVMELEPGRVQFSRCCHRQTSRRGDRDEIAQMS
jgi:hypothetical protein